MAKLCNARVENQIEQQELYNYLFSDKINIGKYSFELVREISRGANGVVYELRDTNHQVNLALKCNDNDDEAIVSEKLKNAGCDILRMKPVGQDIWNKFDNRFYQGKNIYFMELAEGTLFTFFKRLKITDPAFYNDKTNFRQLLLNIGETVRRQMVCIRNIDNDYVYTDLKITNVLYKCENSHDLNTVRFFLGDLGSVVKSPRDNAYTCTYVPFEHRANYRLNLVNDDLKDAAMSWQIGMLILSYVLDGLTQPIYEKFNWKNIHTTKFSDVRILINRLNDVFGPTISNLLNPDPLLRTKISQVLFPPPDPLPIM
jgi:hypothetical protein